MHRNTFINSPNLLNCHYQTLQNNKIFFAGQITGVEGYIESASSGLLVGLYLSQIILKGKVSLLDKKTAIGALAQYVSDSSVEHFQPMNINFGIIEPLGQKVRKKAEKNELISKRALEELDKYIKEEL
jgi:methylenetetrahydrofolate--tRNA-(uracil-5-)-methyltransferase